MINTAPRIMFWMRAYPLRGQVEGGWALEIESYLGPVKWHRADRRVPFGAPKVRDMHASKTLCKGLYKSEVHRWFYAKEAHKGAFRAHTVGGGGAGK
jgi:hypothetical protein